MAHVTADQAEIGSWYLSEHGKEVKVLERAEDGRTKVFSHWAKAATIVPAHYVLEGPIEPPVDSEDGFQFAPPGVPPSAVIQPPPPPSSVSPQATASRVRPDLPAGDITTAPGLTAAVVHVLRGTRLTRNQVYDLLAPQVPPEGRDLLQARISTSLTALCIKGEIDEDGMTYGGVEPSNG